MGDSWLLVARDYFVPSQGVPVRRYKRYALLTLLGVGVLVLLMLVYDFMVAYDRRKEVGWIGGYPVQVSIERSSPRPVSSVSAAVLFRYEWEACEGDASRIDSGWKVMPATGEPFTVEVKCVGTDSGLGLRNSYSRQELLVLRVSYLDGSTELVVADLPDMRGGREMSVRVP